MFTLALLFFLGGVALLSYGQAMFGQERPRGAVVGVQLAANGSTAPGSFGVSGSVDGLYPGGTRTLPLVVTNPNDFAIELTRVDASVETAPGCPSNSVTIGSPSGRVIVPAQGSATAALPVRMLPTATDACQLVTFPLTFTATASEADVTTTSDTAASTSPSAPSTSAARTANAPSTTLQGSGPSVLGTTSTNPGLLPKTGSAIARQIAIAASLTAVGLLLIGAERFVRRRRHASSRSL